MNVVASALQKRGVIRYVHGRMAILDRRALKRCSCERYATVKDQFDCLHLCSSPLQQPLSPRAFFTHSS